jgi:hypothetical protein
MPVIPVAKEAKIDWIAVEGQPRQKDSKIPISKTSWA